MLYCTACGAANAPGATFCSACGQLLQPIPHASTGDLAFDVMLQQRYRILARLGSGGFGAVYKVADIKLGNRILAVKEMSQSGLKPQEATDATEAFKREALMLANHKYSSLPRIYDHFTEAGRWYLVMDFIEGETLEEHLHNAPGRRLPSVEEVLDIGIQLCAVLDYLHTRQPPIIFRDLKPANIMLTPDGAIYLIDFGIARHFKPGQAKDTIAFGSPGYAAPEQYGKAQTTARADIYSLGATLHQLLTGNDPSETPFTFAPPQTIPVLAQLIMQMVNVDASRRPASIAEVKQKLQYLVTQLKTGTGGTGSNTLDISSGSYIGPYPAGQYFGQPAQGIIPTSDIPLLKYSIHTDKIRCVAWSPDGTRIASASEDRTVQVWEAATGKPIAAYRGHSDSVNAIAWSPDGKHIVSASSDKTAQVWNPVTGTPILTYRGHAGWMGGGINAVAWSPDGARIATASHDKTVQVWNATSGMKIPTYRGHSGGVWALAWSPDSKFIASGGYSLSTADATLHIWDASTRQSVLEYTGHYGGVLSIAWSPDGTRIASTSSDMKTLVWHAATGNLICTYRGHIATVWTAAWSPNGTRIASGGSDATVQIWDADTAVTLFKYTGHSATAWAVVPEVRTVAWSPDGRYIALGGSDNTVVQVWETPL